MPTLAQQRAWIALNMVPGVGAMTYQKLLNAFGDPQRVFAASYHELIRIPNLHEKTARSILEFGDPDTLKKELDEIVRHQVRIITYQDEAYPKPLRTIFDPPPVLYVKGQELPAYDILIAVVGSRKASTYGRTVAKALGRDLALKGLTVISGMARGIDSAAHKGALEAGGRTVAVLGCGVDVIYPPEHAPLYHDIIAQGAVISEFPMATKPDRGNFPSRNRIISGMSLGTVVVEAGLQSGALITADTALEQGRDVFAVPGNITSASSQGTNRLIKQGACLVEDVDDILQALSLEIQRELQGAQPELPLFQHSAALQPPPRQLPALTPDETRVFAALDVTPRHIDDITVRVELASGTVSAVLMMLEMKNVARQLAGKMFARI